MRASAGFLATQPASIHRTENLGEPKARTGRGFTYNYLAAIMATVSSNIRRIMVRITKLHTADANGESKKRARKRRGSNGQRLAHAAKPTTPSISEAVMPPDVVRDYSSPAFELSISNDE